MRGEIRVTNTGKRRYFLEGREVAAAEFDAAFPAKPLGEPATSSLTGWPLVSSALAVHPSQVEAANARNARHGIAARYDRKGKAVIPDRGDRKRLMRLEGMHDNEAGYGD